MTTNEGLASSAEQLDIDQVVEVERVLTNAFDGLDTSHPVLGATDDVIVSPDLRGMLTDSRSIVSTLKHDGHTVGASVAIPIGVMDPSRAQDTDTAYIYYTGIEPDWQGNGLVGPLMRTMFGQLAAKGYTHVEQDNIIANGYASKVGEHYRESIEAEHSHEGFPGLGPQRFYRINVARAIDLATKRASDE